MSDVYDDLEFVTRSDGIMTHMIPRVMESIEPWLREHVTDDRFWDGKHDPSHTGVYPLSEMTIEEAAAAWEMFSKMPNPLTGK